MPEIKFPFDIDQFFDKCVKHKNIPKNDFEKQAILIKLVSEFKDNKKYQESEVDAVIRKYFEDYTLLRRELINFGYLQRNPYKGEYWVKRRILTKKDIDHDTILKRHAKDFLLE